MRHNHSHGVLAELLAVAKTKTCKKPLIVATLSATLSAVLYLYDTTLGYNFIQTWMPEGVVFNVFITFTSLIAGFRTSHALGRYTDAAAYMHKLQAMWFDSASTLIAFCRVASAQQDDVDKFRQVLIRLVSVLSAFSLESLQRGDDPYLSEMHRFEVLGSEDFDPNVEETITNSPHKVECVFQMIQALVVDGMKAGVLSIAPPILSRSFQELGAGLAIYHEAKKLSCVPLPLAYVMITGSILVAQAIFVPFIMATYTKGIFSAFLYTWVGTFLLWFMNGVADALDNPFRKEARTLDATSMQRELNEHLMQLLEQASDPTPGLIISVDDEECMQPGPSVHPPARKSFHTWQSGLQQRPKMQYSSPRLGRASNLSWSSVNGSPMRANTWHARAGTRNQSLLSAGLSEASVSRVNSRTSSMQVTPMDKPADLVVHEDSDHIGRRERRGVGSVAKLHAASAMMEEVPNMPMAASSGAPVETQAAVLKPRSPHAEHAARSASPAAPARAPSPRAPACAAPTRAAPSVRAPAAGADVVGGGADSGDAGDGRAAPRGVGWRSGAAPPGAAPHAAPPPLEGVWT